MANRVSLPLSTTVAVRSVASQAWLPETHEGSYKFSLHYRAAQQLAIEERLTMKKAFLKIGPWTDVRLRDNDDVADFFNLENHAIQ
jgi:hypothetical protein